MSLVVRATGQGVIWPSTALNYTTEVDASALLSGEIVFTVPMVKSKSLNFSDFHVDVHFTSQWSSATVWPDTDNVLFDRLPINEFLQQWTNELNFSFAPQLVANLKKVMLVPNISIDCVSPSFVPMICTSSMKQSLELPTQPCHPCDTCCKCYVQQRCDSGCETCECMSCKKGKESMLQAVISTLFLVFSAILFWHCYKKTFLHKSQIKEKE